MKMWQKPSIVILLIAETLNSSSGGGSDGFGAASS
jgi:hypothetical protein